MSTEDRFLRRLGSGKRLSIQDVRRLGRYASLMTLDGQLYEYDQGSFWHSRISEDDGRRARLADDPGVPRGPWCHHPLCDCSACLSGGDQSS